MSNSNQNYLYKYISEQTGSKFSDEDKIQVFKRWAHGEATRVFTPWVDPIRFNVGEVLSKTEKERWKEYSASLLKQLDDIKLPKPRQGGSFSPLRDHAWNLDNDQTRDAMVQDFASKVLDSGQGQAKKAQSNNAGASGHPTKKIELFKAWFSSPIGPKSKAVWKKLLASLTDGEKARLRDRITYVSPEGASEKDAVNFFTSRVLDSGKGIGKQAELLTLTNAFVMPGIRYRNSRVDNLRVSIPLVFTREKTSAQARKEGENFESFIMNNNIKLEYSTIDQNKRTKRDSTGIAIIISGVNLKTNINKSFVWRRKR